MIEYTPPDAPMTGVRSGVTCAPGGEGGDDSGGGGRWALRGSAYHSSAEGAPSDAQLVDDAEDEGAMHHVEGNAIEQLGDKVDHEMGRVRVDKLVGEHARQGTGV